MSIAPVVVTFLDADSLAHPLNFDDLAQVDFRRWPTTSPQQVAERIADADVVIVNKVRLTAELIAQAPRLKLICVSAAGMDNVDQAAARARGIPVRNAPGYGDDAVAEHVIAVTLALRRSLLDYARAATDGRWSASPFFCWYGPPVRDLAGSVMGIVGRGRIGEATARLARGLGMQVRYAQRDDADTRPDGLPLDTLLAEADVLSLHVPLTDDTRGLIDARRLALMKPSALLVNTARGALVQAQPLIDALRGGRLAGAALDVLDVEPPPPDHPLLNTGLPNLLVTPHVAWASEAAQARLAGMVEQAVRAFVAGQA